jgi:alkyldihydroxyacetonephosphate synthase
VTDRRSYWAWGMESHEPTPAKREAAARAMSERFGKSLVTVQPRSVDQLDLRPSRITPPASLSEITTTDTYERAFHTYGHSFRDRVRKFAGDFPNPTDVVAYPRNEADVVSLLDWCAGANYTISPFGGGSSVVGGVEAPDGYDGIVTMDMTRMDQVLEVDATSRAVRVQGGTLGPRLEAQLKPHGFTMRHFPQSFEYSTVGGWIVTRSGGHYATNETRIDDFVESVRMVTPSGPWESFRLPGSGAGPSPDRLALGSEGILGVVTEAWMRIQGRPRFRASTGVSFPSLESVSEAARAIAQAKLWPANLRVLDPGEGAAMAGLDGKTAILIIGFESADVPQDAFIKEAVSIARDAGGQVDDDEIVISPAPAGAKASNDAAGRQGAVGAWRNAFINLPFDWNDITGLGFIADTFETSITWDRWPEFDRSVRGAVQDAMNRVCGGGTITARFTHIYPDGPAPYYSFTAPGIPGSELSQWLEIKTAASEALIAAGGTITHHHAVGRDHRPWYDKQRPETFATALWAAKKSLDPNSILNPGVLIDP